MYEMKGCLESINRLYQQLDDRISEKGGLETLFGLHAKIQEFVDSISASELESILNEIHKAKKSLNQVQQQVTQIRLWKEVFNSAKSQATSTG